MNMCKLHIQLTLFTFNTKFVIFISTNCNFLFRVWAYFNQFCEIALLCEPEAI